MILESLMIINDKNMYIQFPALANAAAVVACSAKLSYQHNISSITTSTHSSYLPSTDRDGCPFSRRLAPLDPWRRTGARRGAPAAAHRALLG